MKLSRLLFTIPVVALALAGARDASACGGCFIQQGESTVVTGHRMIFSVSPQATTLWDQIVYSGDPSSFAWVLPVNGLVDVGLSSDALFQTLEELTQVYISSPTISCPQPPSCGGSGAGAGNGGTFTTTATGTDTVTVVAQETVGPYETVQLASADPNALQDWLTSHGYNIPGEISPVVTAYVNAGFNFLALRLVPGVGVDSMRPVRITTPGAGATLPLRMVAAGTGAVTPITLWVLGEGRYEPQNFPSFEIRNEELVWDWDQERSNYVDLKQVGFEATDGAGWLIEAGEPTGARQISWPLESVVQRSPEDSGYGDENGVGAAGELAADLEALLGNIPQGSLWVNRLHAELSRQALVDDLDLSASADQVPVNRYFTATQTVGTAPECPPIPDDPCGEGSGNPGGTSSLEGDGDDLWGGGGACAMERRGGVQAALGGLAVLAALGLARRRRRAP